MGWLKTFTGNVAAYILQDYPDVCPYDLNPLPHNVIPQYTWIPLKPENRNKLITYRLRTGVNAVNIFGDNPYTIPRQEALSASLPLERRGTVAALQAAAIGSSVIILEQVETSTHAVSFKVRVGADFRLLKIFYPASHEAFMRECRAYAYLMNGKVHQQGAVLECFGRLTLPVSALPRILSLENLSRQTTLLAQCQVPLEALLFEYRPNGTPITVDNVTAMMAEPALRSLCAIHSAHVRHGSLKSGFRAVSDADRVFWVNFEESSCDEDPSLDRQALFKELEDGWDYFCKELIPDKFLGIKSSDLRGGLSGGSVGLGEPTAEVRV